MRCLIVHLMDLELIKDANVFVISHKTELHDKFNSVIKFDKVKGFSQIVS